MGYYTIQSKCLQPMEGSAVSGAPEDSLAAPARQSEGNRKIDAVQVISSEGHDFMIDVGESSTVLNLKESIDEEIGVGTSRQDIFMLGYPLTDDDALLEDFTKFCSTFTVVIPAQGAKKDRVGKKPIEFRSYKAVFLITEGSKYPEVKHLDANDEEWIQLKTKRFGIVKHIEGEELGKQRFHFRVYEVKREGCICLRHEDGRDKVYLVIEEGPNGEEVELRPVDLHTYDESTKVFTLDRRYKISKAMSSWVGAFGSILSGGVTLAQYFA